MNFIKNLNFLLQLLRYTSSGFSLCKIYQLLELKKLNISDEIIEFGSNNYDESLIKFTKKKIIKYFFQ